MLCNTKSQCVVQYFSFQWLSFYAKQTIRRQGEGGEWKTHTEAETHLHTYIIQLSACVCVCACVCICQFEALAIVCLPTKAPEAAACRAKGEDGGRRGKEEGWLYIRTLCPAPPWPRPMLNWTQLNWREASQSAQWISISLSWLPCWVCLCVSACVCVCLSFVCICVRVLNQAVIGSSCRRRQRRHRRRYCRCLYNWN